MPHIVYPIANFHKQIKDVWQISDFDSDEGPVIGLEFENELPNCVDFGGISGWRFHQENSLRDFGYEFVSTNPKPRSQLEKFVESLFRRIQVKLDEYEEITKFKMTPSNSIRTSVHVHLNARNLTYIQVLNFAIVYWLLEDFMTAFCGETRRGNLFCLRMRDAVMQKHHVVSELKNLVPYSSQAFNDNQRYASLNLAAIRKFGSFESRLMRGTTDINVVMTWVDCLLAIYKFALEFKTPRDIKQDFLNSCDARDYPMHVLGFGLSMKMLSMMEVQPSPFVIASDIRENYIELSDLFSCHKTFDFTAEAEIQNQEIEQANKESDAFLAKTLANMKKKKIKTIPLSGGTGDLTATDILSFGILQTATAATLQNPVSVYQPIQFFSEPETEQENSDDF